MLALGEQTQEASAGSCVCGGRGLPLRIGGGGVELGGVRWW